VPIHRLLVPIIEHILKVQSISTDRVFRIQGRPVNPESFKRQWQRGVRGIEPRPGFHDLRHTWKTNALEAGIDEEIRKAILGHLERKQSVSEGYGRISDGLLVASIDRMVFDEAFRKASVKWLHYRLVPFARVPNVYQPAILTELWASAPHTTA